ncbi:hypothetical protein H4R21_004752 [Coemansia helicoidea]|uniref:Uncharacterized protein n=1 Tax=Coemansia helicoidea TaxID=1286919 RepID=A0ACC1KX49_9FUNG|nr:hypothetical protein H4R21_004752 [Coemansia helicoidea]
MDEFARSLQPQVLPLSVLDTQGSFSNIPFVFFYENKTGAADFMPTDMLRDSFFRTMQFFPMFGGHLRSKGLGNVSIVIDPHKVNMPDYSEDSGDVHFDALKEARFRWSAWPDGVATAGAMTKAGSTGEIKLINVHVVRLKENSGVIIYFSIPHYVVDGESHMAVIRRWAEVYALMHSGQQSAVDALPGYTFDRAFIAKCLPEKRTPLNSETQETLGAHSYLADLVAWISPTLRGYLLDKVVSRQRAETHLFHVSAASIQSLRESLREHVADIDGVSVNELLLSLTTKTLVQSQQLAGCTDGRGQKTIPIAVIFEARKLLNQENAEFIGNVLMPKLTLQSIEDLALPTSAETLAKTMAGNSETARNFDAPLFGSFVDLVGGAPASFARPVVRYVRSKSAISFVYDIMPDMYKADFGLGRPEWVSPIQPFRANATLLLTPRDAADGVDVFLTAYPKAMEEVLKNEYWTSVAQLIY